MFKFVFFLTCMLISYAGLSQDNNSKMLFYVATMDPDYNEGGIALYNLDMKSGKISLVKVFDTEPSSDYLTLSNDQNYLYTVDQSSDQKSALVTSFSIDHQTGELKYVDEGFTDNNGPCHITVDNSDKFIIVAHYEGGSISVLRALSDGKIGEVTENIHHVGKGANPDRQEAPHPHMACVSPKKSYVLVPDLGIDKIMCYQLTSSGKLKPTKQTGLTLPPGSGPRHMAFHPSGIFGFVVDELNSTVISFSFNKSDGSMEIVDNVRSIPEDYTEDNYLAAVHISPDGKYLYTSNRGHNSISIFKVDQKSGKLELMENVSCGGDWPRAFNITPGGEYLVVGNERSDNILVFKIDQLTGKLTKTDENTDFPAPRCFKFLYK